MLWVMGTAATERVDIIDETFIDASAVRLAATFADPRNHPLWWPHLQLVLQADRGASGSQWRIFGAIEGNMEIWLEPHWEGAIVHHYVRGVCPAGAGRQIRHRHALRWKAAVNALKDRIESLPE